MICRFRASLRITDFGRACKLINRCLEKEKKKNRFPTASICSMIFEELETN